MGATSKDENGPGFIGGATGGALLGMGGAALARGAARKGINTNHARAVSAAAEDHAAHLTALAAGDHVEAARRAKSRDALINHVVSQHGVDEQDAVRARLNEHVLAQPGAPGTAGGAP